MKSIYINKILLLFLTSFMVGCSGLSETKSSNWTSPASSNLSKPHKLQDTHTKFISNSYAKDVLIVGIASVGLGSLALHDTGSSFKTANERWFQEDTKFAGMDKLGHAWYGATIADYFYERNQDARATTEKSAALASVLSLGIMSLIEVADGYAANSTGFSTNDLIADAVGAGFSYLRNTNPELKELVDFRMEYLPDLSVDEWKTETFYSDQKYVLAWKLAGIDKFKKSPLKFFEVHTGYYARGYSSNEAKLGVEKSRNGYVGIGLNLAEIFKVKKLNKRGESSFTSNLLEHFQVPYTYVESRSKL